MAIRIYNTLIRDKAFFEPIHEGEVYMYHCGPTVYDYAHIGNMRAYVFADILRRTFEWNKYKVKQIINITDVGHPSSDEDDGEDKIETASQREHKSAEEVAKFYTDIFFSDLKKLNVNTTDTIFPRASEHIPEQIELVRILEEKGFAYKTSKGIYFDTMKFPDYGKLALLDIKNLREGARVEINPEKRNPTDFSLWKFSPTPGVRQQEWDSPWGIGFPGWHIECSAMSMKYLGNHFDIHTGGVDHISVHHTNEIAQSEAATGEHLANYWMHSAFLSIDGQKMSKSIGNFTTLTDIEKSGISPLAFRYFLLGTNYRMPLNFTWSALSGAEKALLGIYREASLFPKGGTVDEDFSSRFKDVINNDFNTPQALALIFELLRSPLPPETKFATLLEFDKVLGLDIENSQVVTTIPDEEVPIPVKNLIDEREIARAKKDFERSDLIRTEIAKLGYLVDDSAEGPKVTKK
ncbi:MAG: cysteine--tRNA ligase [Candidatus Paceibacterota bacterium]|jgi:cysteinyl-tRNA synthetase